MLREERYIFLEENIVIGFLILNDIFKNMYLKNINIDWVCCNYKYGCIYVYIYEFM